MTAESRELQDLVITVRDLGRHLMLVQKELAETYVTATAAGRRSAIGPPGRAAYRLGGPRFGSRWI
jgi:hypothetical protein